MKRTITILAVSLALAAETNHDRLAAQTSPGDPSVAQAKQAIDEQDQRIGKMISFFYAENPGDSAEKRDTLGAKLRPLVDQAFDLRQRLQKAELEELRRRFGDIEQAIETRESNRHIIITARLNELVTGRSASGQRAGYLERRTSVDGKAVIVPVPIYDVPKLSQANTFQTNPANERIPKARVPGIDAQSGASPLGGSDERRPQAHTPRADARPPEAVHNERPLGQQRATEGTARPDTAVVGVDIETLERLAQIDVKEAEEDLTGAEKELARVRSFYDTGTISGERLATSEKEHRHAVADLERAKAKLRGLAQQRAELEAAAADAVADVLAQRERAAAKLAEAEAALATGKAQYMERLVASEAARKNVAGEQEQYDGLKELEKEGAVPARQMREAERALTTAKGALGAAVEADKVAESLLAGLQAAIDTAKAELHRAERRVEAAQARLDRLKRPAANAPTAVPKPPDAKLEARDEQAD